MQDTDLDLVGAEFLDCLPEGLECSLHIRTENNAKLLDIAQFHLLEELVEGYLRGGGKFQLPGP